MNDLNQIISNNNKAGADDIPKQRALGKFVVATYAGISYLAHSLFDTKAEADTHAEILAKANPIGERSVVLEPVKAAEYTPSGDAPATLASLNQAAADRRARNEALATA